MPVYPDVAQFELAPDWVCEVLSPQTARHDKISKLQLYAENNVPYYWIVDPLNRVLEILALDGKTYKLALVFGKEDLVKAPPFDELEFRLGSLWAD
jgi:Uma2 family endonuclease